jgi:hypothetical protein
LEVSPEFDFEFVAAREASIALPENGYILEGEAGLTLVWDEVEDVLTERFEDGFSVLSYCFDAQVTCEGDSEVRG